MKKLLILLSMGIILFTLQHGIYSTQMGIDQQVQIDEYNVVPTTPIYGRIVKWQSSTDFNKGTYDQTTVTAAGDDSTVQIIEQSNVSNDIDYETEAEYTLSDSDKIEVDTGSVRLKAITGSTTNYTFTTAGNYTYDASSITVTGGVAQLNCNGYTTFGGTDEYASIGDKANLDFGTTNFSVSFWLKTNSNADAQLIGKQDTGSGWYIYINNATSSIYFYHRVSDAYVQSTLNIVDGAWHNVVFIKNGSSGYIYIDNVDRTTLSNNISATVNSVGDVCEFGRRNLAGSPDRYFAGSLDSIAFWKTNLTVSNISAIYNSGTPANLTAHAAYANCVSYWKMGEGDTFPTLTDTKDSNNATLTNMEASDLEVTNAYAEIVNNNGWEFSQNLSGFNETATKPATTAINYQVSSDTGTTWQWWAGSSWTVITDGQTGEWYYTNESTNASAISSNISTFASSGTFKFRAFLHSSDGTTISLNNLEIEEVVTYSTLDNLYADTKDITQIDVSGIKYWLTTTISSSIPSNTDVRILFSNDGRSSWLTWNGVSWVAPTSSTTRTDATNLTTATTNFASLPIGSEILDTRLFIYSSLNSVRPNISNINVTSYKGFYSSATYTSNIYDSSYSSLDWGIIEWNTSGSTITIRVRASNDSTDMGSYSSITNGVDSGVTGRYVQWISTFTGSGLDTPFLEDVSIGFVIPYIRELNP